MIKKLKIGLDFDGTLARTGDFVASIISLKEGQLYTFKNFGHYDWVRETKEREEAFWTGYNVLDHYLMRAGLEPYDSDTANILRELLQLDILDIHIVTANDEQSKPGIIAWLKVNDIPLPEDKVHCIGRVKSPKKLELDFDLYIDDSSEIPAHIVKYPNKQMLLANAKWNEFYDRERTIPIDDTKQVHRFREWKELPKLLKELFGVG